MTERKSTASSGIARRALLLGTAAGAGALALGAGALAPHARAQSFVKGADISWMPQMEANGYSWRDSAGEEQDLLSILAGYGISAISLRTWVDPSDDPVSGHCGVEETAEMAARCQDAGMQVLIGFHFGDTWNSVGEQHPPAAWADMSYDEMRQAMYDYVSDSMNVLQSNGVTPTWVKIGNETNSGICHPVGSVSEPAQMTGLLMAAYEMVKEVFPDTLVLVHAAQPQELDSVRGFLSAYQDNGGQWDITGLSSYAQGDDVAPILDAIETIQNEYGKPVMHVEYGGEMDDPDQVRDSLREFIAGLQGFGGLGTFYWEPEGYPSFSGYTMSAWDEATQQPTSAMDGFLDAK